MSKQKILVVDDEYEIAELMRFHLEKSGFDVLVAHSGSQALDILAQHSLDLAILDVMLPEFSGVELCRKIRSGLDTAQLPVLFVTAKDEESDELKGFQVGGDDYLSKPFSFKVFLARVEALLKRQRNKNLFYEYGELSMDFQRHTLKIGGERLSLTSREFALLSTLVKQKHRTLSRQTLLERCWAQGTESSLRSVDVVITRLRPKLGAFEKHLRTVTGYGYQWDEDE